jgi:hypothetical protein
VYILEGSGRSAEKNDDIITDAQNSKGLIASNSFSVQLRAKFEILLVENTLKSCPQPRLARPHCRGPAAFLNKDDCSKYIPTLKAW